MIGTRVLVMKNLIYRLFVKYFLPKHNLTQDQYIEDMAGERYRIDACYYTEKLTPIYIVTDKNGQIRSFPQEIVGEVND